MGEGDGCEGRVESIIRTKICEIVNSVGHEGKFYICQENVRERSWKCQKSLAVATIYLSSPGISLWSCHHHFFLIEIVLFCLAFSFFVIVFFAFLVERCRNVSQGDDVAAALNWSSELLYSRWVFSPVTNHITIHTFGFFLEGFSTWGKRPLLELSFGLFQVNVTGIEVSLVVRYCVVVKTDILFSITKSAWTRISKIVFNLIRRVKC